MYAVNPHSLRVGIIKDWDSRWYNVPFQKSHLSQALLKVKPFNTPRWNSSPFQVPHTCKTSKPWNSYSNLPRKYKK